MKAKTFLLAVFSLLMIVVSAQEVKVDVSKSELKWEGRKVTGKHFGKITLKEGNLMVKNNKIESGTFVINMNTITVDDLPAGEWNEKLVGHLKSDDFFGTEKHPESKLVITHSTPFVNNKANVKGKLTIKNITKPVEFEAVRNGKNYSAIVKVDRSEYDVKYGSGKFFKNLGDNLIYDEFTLDVTLATK
jgi:polyisoprenoid-binding protein YceI